MRKLICFLVMAAAAATGAEAGHGEGYYHVSLSAGAHVLTSTDVGSVANGHLLVTGDPSGSTIDGITIAWPNSGYAGTFGGETIEFYNEGTNPITIVHHSSATGVTAGNWISTIDGRDATLAPGERLKIVSDVSEYDMVTGYTYFGWREDVQRTAYFAGTPSSPSRSIGTAWQPNAARPTLVIASLAAACSLTLVGGSAGHIDVKVGDTSSPTTVIGSVPCGNTGTVVVGVNSTVTTGGVVSYIVRPGDWVKVTTTNITGTPTYTLAVAEEPL